MHLKHRSEEFQQIAKGVQVTKLKKEQPWI